MASVRLRPIADAELPEHIERSRAGYAASIEHDGGIPREEAVRKAAADFEALFPGGRPIEGQHIFVLEDEAATPVGRLHYAERPLGSERVWLYEIWVDAAVRGRGLGRAAMLAFEEHVRNAGYTSIAFNVFGGNEPARSLYRSLGYREVALEMAKDLDV